MENDFNIPKEYFGFWLSGKEKDYFNKFQLMKINVGNCPVDYMYCNVFCNGKDYTSIGVVEINYYDNSILIYKKDKKGNLIVTKNNNIKKVKIYGKIKIFFREVKIEEADFEETQKAE